MLRLTSRGQRFQNEFLRRSWNTKHVDIRRCLIWRHLRRQLQRRSLTGTRVARRTREWSCGALTCRSGRFRHFRSRLCLIFREFLCFLCDAKFYLCAFLNETENTNQFETSGLNSAGKIAINRPAELGEQ